VTTLAGVPPAAGTTPVFVAPLALVVDGSGNVFVADTMNQEIRRITPGGTVSSYAGTARKPGHADGPAAGSSFANPSGVAVDTAGNLYVADTLNGTIRRITP
jgi:sugar lactone lactonase YvrE